MQVLLALLEQPGQIVTREELRQRIWPADTFVDFEHSLNTAIKKLRLALGDRATNSRFVETLPRRGYRFWRKWKPARKNRGQDCLQPMEGKVFTLVAEDGTECVLAPVDGKSLEEWRRLLGLNDDVGVSMMITEKRLLLLEAGNAFGCLRGRQRRLVRSAHPGRRTLRQDRLLSRKSLKAPTMRELS